jgi:hypothetical protein
MASTVYGKPPYNSEYARSSHTAPSASLSARVLATAITAAGTRIGNQMHSL